MLSGLTKICFSYFLSICVHNQKLLYKHVTIASQSLILISLLTVTLRFDESFLNTKCGLLAKTLRYAHEQNVDIPNVNQKGQLRRQKTKDVNRNRNKASIEEANLTRKKTKF